MPIDVGDCVLTLLFDESDAMAKMATVGERATGALAPATAAVDGVTKSTQGLGAELDATAENVPFAGEAIRDAMGKAEYSTHAARGEAALLAEMFGIHLPRHVRSFLAELPGVGAALSSAFAATAIIFIIEALAQGVEKLIEMSHHSERVAEAWKKVQDATDEALSHMGDELLRVQIRIDELNGNKLGALQKTLELIDHTTLKELEKEIQKIEKDTEDAFKQMHSWWDWLTTFGQGNQGLADVNKQFEDLTKKYYALLKAGDELGAAGLLVRGLQEAKDKLIELQGEEQKAAAQAVAADNARAGVASVVRADAEKRKEGIEKEIEAQKRNIATLEDFIKVQAKSTQIELAKDEVARKESARKDDSLAQEKALLAAQEQLGQARLRLERAQSGEEVEITKTTYSLQNAASKQAFAQQLEALAQLSLHKRDLEMKTADAAYQLQVNGLNDQLTELKKHGEKTLAEQTRIQTQLRLLDIQHQTQQIESYTKFVVNLRHIMSQPIPLINSAPPGMDQIDNAVTRGFKQAEDAAASLGITLRSQLDSSLRQAFDNYTKLEQAFKEGLVTQQDVKNAYIALVQQQLDFAIKTHASTDEVKKLQKQLAELTGQATTNIDKFGKHSHATFQQFVADLKNGVSGMQEMKSLGEAAFDGLTQAFESSLEAAILGEKGFGQAMEEATAKVLASLAAQAIVKAIFYTAEGFAALAGFAEESASEYFTAAAIMGAVGAATGAAAHALAGAAGLGSSGKSSSTSSSSSHAGAAATAQPQPQPTINVAHFAAGGLITQPTMAVVGEVTEGIIPLQDRTALQAIANAITAQMQGSQGHDICIQIHTDVPGFAKVLNHNVKTGRVRLMASDSIRVTRRS